MESPNPQPKFTPTQQAALQRLWIANYMRKFPLALYEPLQELVCNMNDASVELFMCLMDALSKAHEVAMKEGYAKYSVSGYSALQEVNPYQEYADRFNELADAFFSKSIPQVKPVSKLGGTIVERRILNAYKP